LGVRILLPLVGTFSDIYIYINFKKVGIRQEHKEHCSAYFAAYNSVLTNKNTNDGF